MEHPIQYSAERGVVAPPGFSGEGSGVLAFAPHYPVVREEFWFFILADPTDNAVLGVTRVSLLEAEYVQSQAESGAFQPPAAARDVAIPSAAAAARHVAAPSAASKVSAAFQLFNAGKPPLAPSAQLKRGGVSEQHDVINQS